jgi:hypothetical protein
MCHETVQGCAPASSVCTRGHVVEGAAVRVELMYSHHQINYDLVLALSESDDLPVPGTDESEIAKNQYDLAVSPRAWPTGSAAPICCTTSCKNSDHILL